MNIEDQTNQSCFANGSDNILISSSPLRRITFETVRRYNPDATRSSLTLLPGSLAANQSYQIRVDLISLQDSSRLYTGYVTVQVQPMESIEVSVGYVSSFTYARFDSRCSRCALPELCPLIGAYRLINSNTQAAFTSLTPSLNYSIAWEVYKGRMNPSIEWTLLENTTQYLGRWFFGRPILSSISVNLMRSFFRAECEKLHLHSGSFSELSDRRVLACSIYLFGWADEWIECTRLEDELPSRERHLFCQSFDWNDQHFVHRHLLELG